MARISNMALTYAATFFPIYFIESPFCCRRTQCYVTLVHNFVFITPRIQRTCFDVDNNNNNNNNNNNLNNNNNNNNLNNNNNNNKYNINIETLTN